MRRALTPDSRSDGGRADLEGPIRLPAYRNGLGASSVAERTVLAASRVLDSARAHAVTSPTVAAASDGGVALEWHVRGRQLELEILPDLSLEFAQFESGSLVDDGVVASVENPDVIRLFRWLVQE